MVEGEVERKEEYTNLSWIYTVVVEGEVEREEGIYLYIYLSIYLSVYRQ